MAVYQAILDVNFTIRSAASTQRKVFFLRIDFEDSPHIETVSDSN